jgi:hypothetical protein
MKCQCAWCMVNYTYIFGVAATYVHNCTWQLLMILVYFRLLLFASLIQFGLFLLLRPQSICQLTQFFFFKSIWIESEVEIAEWMCMSDDRSTWKNKKSIRRRRDPTVNNKGTASADWLRWATTFDSSFYILYPLLIPLKMFLIFEGVTINFLSTSESNVYY